MKITAIALFAMVCIFGRFILGWRRVALAGFGLGRSNVPPVFHHTGNVLIWVMGQAFFWGAAVAIFFISAWYWSILAIFLSYALEHKLVLLVFRGAFERALEFKKKHHYDESDNH